MSPTHGVTPTHAVAIMVGGTANVVWINREGFIYVYTAPQGSEQDRAASEQNYILTAPRIDNRPVKVRDSDPRLATIDYAEDGAEMWRIYYFNEQSYLCEIKSDGDGGWERGSLDAQMLQVNL